MEDHNDEFSVANPTINMALIYIGSGTLQINK